jgi:hypothetical protein
LAKFLRLINGVPKHQDEAASTTIYNERYQVNSTITTGTPITLPASGTYNSAELEVRLNGVKLEPVYDYNYVSTPPRTQVTMTFDLVNGDELTFRVDRAP